MTFPNTSDVGVVVLDDPVTLPDYAVLAPLRYLDQFLKIQHKATVTFTAVGYGIQDSTPDVVAELSRYQATTRLVNRRAMGMMA